jgi:hypothetical protein
MSAVFPRLPIALAAPTAFAPSALSVDQAREVIRQEIGGSFVRPSDIDRANVSEPTLLQIPFWCIEAFVDGFHLGIGTVRGAGGRSRFVPTGGARRRGDVVMVSARRDVPYDARLHNFIDGMGSQAALTVELKDLVPGAPDAGELLDADVTQKQAERTATELLMNRVGANHALYAKYDRHIDHVAYLFYPMWYASYRYQGEASPVGESCFVLACARTGRIVACKHPSKLRAVTAKLRRLLSFQAP